MWWYWTLPLGAGLALLAGSWLLWRRTRRARGWWLRIGRLLGAALLVILALTLVTGGGAAYWFYNRPQPEPQPPTPIFEGVTYTRDVRSDPRPLVIHIVTVDLTAPGIELLVTPGDSSAGNELIARTTSDFLDDFDVQVAVNGSFFVPFHTNGPWDYYPHSGDPIGIDGYAMSGGVAYSGTEFNRPIAFFTADNRVIFAGEPSPDLEAAAEHAISGSTIFLRDNVLVTRDYWGEHFVGHHPRTALGLDAAGTTLILAVVDGRQPNYSEGVSLNELAGLMQDYGAVTVMNLDGGGSSTLVVERDGAPDVLNSPINHHIPGNERVVGNHLGIRALPLE